MAVDDAETVMMHEKQEIGRAVTLSSQEKVFIKRWYLIKEIEEMKRENRRMEKTRERMADWEQKWFEDMGKGEWDRKCEILSGMKEGASIDRIEDIDRFLQYLKMPDCKICGSMMAKFKAVNDGNVTKNILKERMVWEHASGKCWFCGEHGHKGKECLVLEWAYKARGEPEDDKDPETLKDERNMVNNRREMDEFMKELGYTFIE